jgi:hypothetical protein
LGLIQFRLVAYFPEFSKGAKPRQRSKAVLEYGQYNTVRNRTKKLSSERGPPPSSIIRQNLLITAPGSSMQTHVRSHDPQTLTRLPKAFKQSLMKPSVISRFSNTIISKAYTNLRSRWCR